MDINFKVKRFENLRPSCIRTVSREETFEYVLPDTMPDAGSVSSVQATALIRSKDPRQGSCTVDGSIELSLTYTSPGDDPVQAVHTSFPVSMAVDEGQITPNALVCADIELVSADARVISSRKMLVKVNCLCVIRCFEPDELIIPIDCEEVGFELSKSEVSLPLTSVVDEKTFEISENFPLDGPAAAQILTWRARVSGVELSLSGDRLIVKGCLKLCITYKPQGGGMPVFVEHATEFIQAVNIMHEGDISEYQGCVNLTSAYVTSEPGLSGDGKSIGFDIGAVFQYIVCQSVKVPCLCDLYSTTSELSCTYAESSAISLNWASCPGASATGKLSIETPVARYLSGHCSVESVTASRETLGLYNAQINACVIWQDTSGNILSKNLRLNVASSAAEGAPVCVTARAGEGVVSPNSDGCEIKVPVDFTAYYLNRQKLSCVSAAVSKPAPHSDEPRVWVTRFTPEGSLWEIGKRHRVSLDAIRKASELADGAEPAPGALLIIPKM